MINYYKLTQSEEIGIPIPIMTSSNLAILTFLSFDLEFIDRPTLILPNENINVRIWVEKIISSYHYI
jgi:hypothetical protein